MGFWTEMYILERMLLWIWIAFFGGDLCVRVLVAGFGARYFTVFEAYKFTIAAILC